jgi:GcrA cell cycle regulator
MNAGIPWSAADDARLAVLWAEGHTVSVLAKAFGRSRNGIVGRVHRLYLPSRPSPINGAKPRTRRTPEQVAARAVTKPVIVAPVVVPPPPPPPPERAPSWGCAWLEGERPTWLRCDAPVWQGTSWCKAHYRICYQRLPVAA